MNKKAKQILKETNKIFKEIQIQNIKADHNTVLKNSIRILKAMTERNIAMKELGYIPTFTDENEQIKWVKIDQTKG